MRGKLSVSRRIFLVADYAVLILFGAACVIPFINLVALSFSSKAPADAGRVFLWPVGVNTLSYANLMYTFGFLRSLVVSFERIGLGVPINFLLIVLTAYPLSKRPADFKGRTVYVWFFVITMLINGGLIPWYLTIRSAGILNSIWALVIPGAVPVFSVVLLLNFFRGLPRELEEAALIDGARHFSILWRIFLPVSTPALATVMLFSLVGHWNSWFDGMILINDTNQMPLQSFLQLFIMNFVQGATNMRTMTPEMMVKTSQQTIKAAFVVISMVPVLVIFPFFQSFLKTGIVMGSVKQ